MFFLLVTWAYELVVSKTRGQSRDEVGSIFLKENCFKVSFRDRVNIDTNPNPKTKLKLTVKQYYNFVITIKDGPRSRLRPQPLPRVLLTTRTNSDFTS